MTKTLAGFFLLSLALSAQEIQFTSTKDGTQQPALFYVPPGAAATDNGPRAPLLVFLHAWSDNYMSPAGRSRAEVMDESRRRGWILIAPALRTPRNGPRNTVAARRSPSWPRRKGSASTSTPASTTAIPATRCRRAWR